ncbi:hypothetical protein BH09PAT4_BH09PAT4_05070 [soil metagenome]
MKAYRRYLKTSLKSTRSWWRASRWHKAIVVIILLALAVFGSMYGIAQWYAYNQRNKPFVQGVTFIPSYANYLGVKPQETMDALLDIGVRHFRLVSYWDQIESTKGHYDFSQLDWQFAKANSVGAKVTLAVGLRQPRWPECHPPSWVNTQKPANTWQPQLEVFLQKVVERYRHNPALKSYQLENEFYNHFGQCYNFDRARLTSELALVKKLDNKHPVIISRSNNYVGLMLRQPLPDEIGISVYRRVWDSQVTHRYFQYPYPAWYYGFLAGGEKILTGKDSVLHELQAEPWPPNGQAIKQISLTEQNKSFDAKQFEDRIKFAKATGMREVYYWGAEYWYYRMVQLHEPSVWNVAKQTFNSER